MEGYESWWFQTIQWNVILRNTVHPTSAVWGIWTGFEQDFTLSFEENPVQNNEIRTP